MEHLTDSRRFNKWLRVSAASYMGDQRPYQEDRFTFNAFTSDKVTYNVFLVLDGHGGEKTAEYVRVNFLPTFESRVKLNGSDLIRKSITETFVMLNRCVQGLKSGTTVAMLLVIEKAGKPPRTLTAHVGDSGIFGVYKDTVRRLTSDHSIKRKGEAKRVTDSGHTLDDGYVVDTANGNCLAMTRAIGDLEFGDSVSSTPEITEHKVPYETIILASDGYWDSVSGAKVWAYAQTLRKGPWKGRAKEVSIWRNREYSQHDNTTIMFVDISRSSERSAERSGSTTVPDKKD